MDQQFAGYLNFSVFSDLITKIIPKMEMAEIDCRYRLAERDCGPDRVTIERLSIMCSYFLLYNAYQQEWRNVGQIHSLFQDFRDKSGESEQNDRLDML